MRKKFCNSDNNETYYVNQLHCYYHRLLCHSLVLKEYYWAYLISLSIAKSHLRIVSVPFPHEAGLGMTSFCRREGREGKKESEVSTSCRKESETYFQNLFHTCFGGQFPNNFSFNNFNSGLNLLINCIFFSLVQFFISFSRAIASEMYWKHS